MDKRMLTPAETCESFYAVGQRKAGLPFGRMLVLAIFGGIFISATSGFGFTEALYEAASAIATVGLSASGTANMSIAAQYLIILYMYFGRVGVLTIALGFLEDRKAERFRYAQTKLMIG